jgi:predicted NBD/HSP70 family sugar kinase
MENIVSGTGVAEQARKLLSGIKTAVELDALTASDVFDAARSGETWAVQIVDETVEYLAMTIATVSTLLDPELVVVSGGVSNSNDLLLPHILERLDGVIQHIPRLEVSTLGARATVMGAISLILHLTKDYYVVRRLY